MWIANRYSLFVSVPLILQVIVLVSFFNIPATYYLGVIFLPTLMLLMGLLIDGVFKRGVQNSYLLDRIFLNREKNNELIAVVFLTVVIFLVPLDIYFNGFKILNPSSYAELNGIGRYIRHFTNFSWIAIPIAYLFIRNRRYIYQNVLYYFLIFFGVFVPVLFVDRNRLLLSFFCLVYFYVYFKRSGLIKRKSNSKAKLFFVILLIVLLFGALGVYRSGESFVVLSSGERLIDGYFPLRDIFFRIPNILQQIILYISTPIFNFATVFEIGFINPDFLLSQLSPFSRGEYDAYPYSPILVPRYNVGTELYPFLLYGGVIYVVVAALLTSLLFLSTVKIHEKYNNIFTLLFFLKMAYTMIMIGFAPQIITFYNLFSIIVLVGLYIGGFLLKPFLKSRLKEIQKS
ncbi:O-antigen polymerase [Aeromonas veronii]